MDDEGYWWGWSKVVEESGVGMQVVGLARLKVTRQPIDSSSSSGSATSDQGEDLEAVTGGVS